MNTPKIRFKGFTDDWEQRKFGEVTKELLDYDNFSSGLPLLTSSRSGLMYQSEYRGNATTENENTLFSVVPLNACTYRHMSDDSTFHLNINTLEKGLVSKEYPVFQENESNLKFIVQYINSSNSFTKFCTEQKKGGTRTRLYYKTLCEYKLMMPSIKEQNKTANFFDTLDHLITLHQRKCDETKQLKKFMLQKMFPKNGEKNPEIRFEGFTDDWEQRKLGEVSSKITKKNQDIVVDEVFTNSAEYGIISQRDFFDKDIANFENIDGYYIVEPNDFVYNPRISTTAPFGPIKRNKLERTGAMSPLYYVFRPHDIDLSYLECFFQTSCWHTFMRFNGNTGARSDRFAITDKVFDEMPISMPQDIEEQQKIGSYFSSLDNLITLHQRKCEKLKELKKFMLQNMFV